MVDQVDVSRSVVLLHDEDLPEIDIPGPFETPDDMTDITFVIEDRKLYFSKTLLRMSSAVFDRMFTSGFKEKEAEEIPLPGKKYQDMVVFLQQIHPAHSGEPITDGTLQQILPLADEYQVESVRKRCEQYVGHQLGTLKREISNDRLLLYLWMTEQYNLTRHRDQLLSIGVERKATDLQKSCYYKSCPPSAKSDLMLKRSVKLETFLYSKVKPKVDRFANAKSAMYDACGNSAGGRWCDDGKTPYMYCKQCIAYKISRAFEEMGEFP